MSPKGPRVRDLVERGGAVQTHLSADVMRHTALAVVRHLYAGMFFSESRRDKRDRVS